MALRQLCDPDFGLMVESEDGGSYEMSPHSAVQEAHLAYFDFLGRLLAKVRAPSPRTGPAQRRAARGCGAVGR